MVSASGGLGDARRGFVLAHVAGFEPGDGDFSDAGVRQLRHILGGQHAPLAEKEASLPHAMGQDRAGSPGHGERPNCMREL